MGMNETFEEFLNLNYTKVPNKYTDEIDKELTAVQSAICRYIIRNTYGWQRLSCKVSNSELAKRTGYSRRGIIKGKDGLLDMGLLIKVNARYYMVKSPISWKYPNPMQKCGSTGPGQCLRKN